MTDEVAKYRTSEMLDDPATTYEFLRMVLAGGDRRTIRAAIDAALESEGFTAEVFDRLFDDGLSDELVDWDHPVGS